MEKISIGNSILLQASISSGEGPEDSGWEWNIAAISFLYFKYSLADIVNVCIGFSAIFSTNIAEVSFNIKAHCSAIEDSE